MWEQQKEEEKEKCTEELIIVFILNERSLFSGVGANRADRRQERDDFLTRWASHPHVYGPFARGPLIL
jgi:hypothetical protein